jgi:superfamily II DNA or RNA helicase
MGSSLRLFDIKPEYRSDRDDLVKDFYVPCLSLSVVYRRAVGYFTSRGLSAAAQGISALINGGGVMRLVASPMFNVEDLDAISKGYRAREDAVTKALLQSFDREIDDLVAKRLGYLAWLIAEQRLEIRIAIPIDRQGVPRRGIYHEKLGLFTDKIDNAIAFTGSPNETSGGLVDNFETIDVFWSWEDPQKRLTRKIENFERLWKNETQGLAVIDFPAAARQKLLQYRPTAKPELEAQPNPIVLLNRALWRHQDEAIAEFLKKERGVLEMATGTGKTRTALRICEHLLTEKEIDSIIVTSDGNDLLDQWYSQLLGLTRHLSDAFALFRHYQMHHERDRFLLNPQRSILLISRLALPLALKPLQIADAKRTILIHDEVHRLGSPGNRNALAGLSDNIRFRLGLSATPEREYDQEGNLFIGDHIGPVIFRFDLEDAIRRGILAPFTYFPLQYHTSQEDRDRLQQVYRKASARAQNGQPMAPEEIYMELSKVYKVSKAKLPIFDDFIKDHQTLLDRCIIFVETKEYGEEVLGIIHRYRHGFHTYFAEEDADVLKRFARGDIDCLLTCHRLSEGIDIQSLKTVILFSSARTRLETIQRIGRCLRTDPLDPQKRANVVDFVRVPHPGEEDPPETADDDRRDWLTHVSQISYEG